MMKRFTAGLVTGTVLTAVGVGMMLSDGKARKRVVRDSRRAVRKAGNIIDGVTDMF